MLHSKNKEKAPVIHYDEITDVLYIELDTEEPSNNFHLDDYTVLEIGMFSNLPTGVKLLAPAEMGIKSLKLRISNLHKAQPLIPEIKKDFTNRLKSIEKLSTSRSRKLEKVMAM